MLAHLQIAETKSPTWASTTSILHLTIASSLEKGKLGKNTTVLQGTKGYRLKHKLWQQWTIVSLLSILSYAFNVSKGSLYSFSKGYWKVESMWSQGIWKAKSQMRRIHVKENSKKDLDYAHISMYTVIGVKPTYVCGYRVKSCVYHFFI